MTRRQWFLIGLIIVTLIQTICIPATSGASTTSGIDEWMMYRHDISHSGCSMDNRSVNSAELAWAFPTHAAVWSSPAVYNGYVLVGCKDATIYCLNASSGTQVWSFPTGGEVNSSPAIYNNNVYVGCDDGWVYCINITTGWPVWISQAGGLIRSSPVVLDNRVFIGSGKQGLYCFNASDGSPLWTFPTKYRVDSSPALSDGLVYFSSEDFFVYAVNATTSQEIWRHHTGSTMNSASLHNGCLYIGSYDGYVFCLNASTGTEMWSYLTQDTVTSSPAVACGYVYVGSEDRNLYCLNASTGNKIWHTPTGYWIWGSPVVSDGSVYVGSEDYNIYCFDAFTGAKKWSYLTGSMVDSSPAIVNAKLYVGSYDYHVYALNLSVAIDESLPVESTLIWTTIAFDSIACVVGVGIIISIIYFIRLNRRTNRSLQLKKPDFWFSAHANLLCCLLILVFSVSFFANLGAGPLWAADEKTYSSMAFHMNKSGDYLQPWSFGEQAIWIAKPPLIMWLMSLSYQAFGITNFATRVWSAIFGILSLVVIFYLGRKLYNSYVGLLSVLVLGTFTMFFEFATRAMTDVPLVFFILASTYCFILSEDIEKTSLYAVLSGAFFGLALMTKQFEALLIPLIIIPYLVLMKKSLRFLFTKRFALFLGIALLIFLPWVIYMDLRFKDFYDCFFVYGFTRTVSPVEGHVRSYLFYFEYLVSSERLIWVALLPFAVGLTAFKSVVKRSRPDTLILLWIALLFGIFTLAQTKIYWYILPAMPAFAIAIGSLLYQVSKKIQQITFKKGS